MNTTDLSLGLAFLAGLASFLSTLLIITIGFAFPPLYQLKSVPATRVLRRDLGPIPLNLSVAYGFPLAVVCLMLYWIFEDFKLTFYLLGGAALTLGMLYGAGQLLVSSLRWEPLLRKLFHSM